MPVRRRTNNEQTTHKYNPNQQIMKIRISIFLLMLGMYAQAQIKVGNNPNSINANSLLELESTNKGFLPPRVALNSFSSESPLSGTVPAGMLVFSSGGTLIDGYYYWNGSLWVRLAGGETNFATKTANATLTKLETFVLASNDIILTLPAITSADNGLAITVKNIGSYMDLVTVLPNGSSTIDNGSVIALPRWWSLTFVANGGNWIFKERTVVAANTLEVSAYGSWQTLGEAIEFLGEHMWGPTVIKLESGELEISETQEIDLPFPLTIQGTSYGTTILAAATGLGNKPMFRCASDCSFKMLQFDATALTGYGTQTGEDAIRFVGTGTYNEIKDCTFDRFYNAILDSTDAEIWVFETDINDAQANGILIHSAEDSVTVKVAETDFIGCKRGINMSKASKATIQLSSGGYYNEISTDTAVVYRPGTFTNFLSISITGNSWNNTGVFMYGFDFSRSDGRDANAFLENNAGMGDKNPNCYIGVNNNLVPTSTALSTYWYKGVWTNTSSSTCKWTINDNRITYQPANRRDGYITISGNLMVSTSSATINIGLVKNPSASSALAGSVVRYGETTLRPGIANQPFQFSTVISVADIAPGDYFEVWCNTGSTGSSVTFQDIQWMVKTQ
jgi:hypothetical protein